MEEDSEYQISVTPVEVEPPLPDSDLIQAVETTLRRRRVGATRINVALVSDSHIARLNEAHLHHHGPTDVLTYDHREDGTEGNRWIVDGEIVISVETAGREAEARGHDCAAEVLLYAVHGTLHLLGFDDHDPDEAARMHDIEDEILTELGRGSVYKGHPS
ncbi:MAG: rRNA maturation RNase YbeY [Planctomycetota bacterium]|jgi:probable rRNA maturation factor